MPSVKQVENVGLLQVKSPVVLLLSIVKDEQNNLTQNILFANIAMKVDARIHPYLISKVNVDYD